VREFSKKQPELRELRRVLLKIGGEELVPPDASDPMTSFLIDFGIVFSGPVLLKVCGHRRPAPTLGHVWSRRLYGIVGVGVGYAMSDDGLWREHTFGILREGVLEIVSPRQKYFGLLLIGEAADGFAEAASR
jgi:hypothetical protein